MAQNQSLFTYGYTQGALLADSDGQYLISITRPQDLTVLLLQLSGFQLNTNKNQFERLSGRESGKLVVWFPPQSIIEEAFFQASEVVGGTASPKEGAPGDYDYGDSTAESTIPTKFPVYHRMSGPSRLVFEIPATFTDPIPNTVADLLNWSEFVPVINTRGQAFREPQQFQLADPSLQVLDEPYQKINDELMELAKVQFEVSSQPNRPEDHWAATAIPSTRVTPASAIQQAADLQLSESVESSFSPVFPGFIIDFDFFKKPGKDETYIEFPYRLYISPNEKAGWDHAKELKEEEAHELWHTRVGHPPLKESAPFKETNRDHPVRFRALWSPDANRLPSTPPDSTSAGMFFNLSAQDRHKLVHQTSNYFQPTNFKPKSFEAWQFMMTSLGAYSDFRFDYDDLYDGLDIEQWIHQSTIGRDHYVRVVYAGYLFPFGHRASLVKITERKIADEAGGEPIDPVALSFQRAFIIIREPLIEYENFQLQNNSDDVNKKMPFKKVLIETPRTPDIDEPGNLIGEGPPLDNPALSAFWIEVGGSGFPFQIKATGLDDREIHFSTPLIFAGYQISTSTDKSSEREEMYQKYNLENAIPLHRQQFAIGPDGDDLDKTVFETEEIHFEGLDIKDAAENTLQFFPALQKAQIYATPVNDLMGDDTITTDVIPFYFEDNALNRAKIFAKLVNPPSLNFSEKGDRGGGIAHPSLMIGALSKIQGPIGGKPDDIVDMTLSSFSNSMQGNFNPQEFFPDTADILPKLFGIIKLTDLLPDDVFDIFDELTPGKVNEKVPQLIQNKLPGKIRTTYKWNPNLIPKNLDGLKFVVLDQDGNPIEEGEDDQTFAPLELSSTITIPITDYSDPFLELVGEIQNFRIELLEIIGIKFGNIRFESIDGGKMNMECNIWEEAGIEFLGFLKFLNVLQKIIPADGFSDPPKVELDGTNIIVGYEQGLPDITAGAFSLQNIKLAAFLKLPIIGDNPLTFTFNFCERYDPFTMTVYIFGGGGFFSMSVNTTGLEKIEASLEFGAGYSLDVGVAKGSVEAKVGVYFAMESTSTSSSITFQGYLRIEGHLEIIKLISLSLTFNMSLTYQKEDAHQQIWGEASMEIKVEVACFSASVSVHVSKVIWEEGASSEPATLLIRASGEDDFPARPAKEFETSYPQAEGEEHSKEWLEFAAAYA
jgi:hypothetical protein